MAKKKAVEIPPEPPSEATGRVSVIHLQGSADERDWLTLANRKTHLPKTTIVRLALADWGSKKKLPPYPGKGD